MSSPMILTESQQNAVDKLEPLLAATLIEQNQANRLPWPILVGSIGSGLTTTCTFIAKKHRLAIYELSLTNWQPAGSWAGSTLSRLGEWVEKNQTGLIILSGLEKLSLAALQGNSSWFGTLLSEVASLLSDGNGGMLNEAVKTKLRERFLFIGCGHLPTYEDATGESQLVRPEDQYQDTSTNDARTPSQVLDLFLQPPVTLDLPGLQEWTRLIQKYLQLPKEQATHLAEEAGHYPKGLRFLQVQKARTLLDRAPILLENVLANASKLVQDGDNTAKENASSIPNPANEKPSFVPDNKRQKLIEIVLKYSSIRPISPLDWPSCRWELDGHSAQELHTIHQPTAAFHTEEGYRQFWNTLHDKLQYHIKLGTPLPLDLLEAVEVFPSVALKLCHIPTALRGIMSRNPQVVFHCYKSQGAHCMEPLLIEYPEYANKIGARSLRKSLKSYTGLESLEAKILEDVFFVVQWHSLQRQGAEEIWDSIEASMERRRSYLEQVPCLDLVACHIIQNQELPVQFAVSDAMTFTLACMFKTHAEAIVQRLLAAQNQNTTEISPRYAYNLFKWCSLSQETKVQLKPFIFKSAPWALAYAKELIPIGLEQTIAHFSSTSNNPYFRQIAQQLVQRKPQASL